MQSGLLDYDLSNKRNDIGIGIIPRFLLPFSDVLKFRYSILDVSPLPFSGILFQKTGMF